MAPSTDAMPDTVRALMPRARDDLERLVEIPSVADPDLYDPEHCLAAAGLVRDLIEEAGLKDCRLLDMPDGHPAVFGAADGPPGAPTVLLYCHYDVQPPLEEDAWRTPPFALTERDGRWYGRGSADCKGNVVLHLTALRAWAGRAPVAIKFIAEGAEEQGTGGIEEFVATSGDLLAADAVIIADAGNLAAGVPTLTSSLRGAAEVILTVSTLESPVHSGMFGGAAPDALIALARMVATLHDENGNVCIAGLEADRSWDGAEYDAQRFRADAGVLDGVDLVGSASIAEMLWVRPSVTVLGLDCPDVEGSLPSLQARARARISMRVPPGLDPEAAQRALADHLRAAAPWSARVEIETPPVGSPFLAKGAGAARDSLAAAMEKAYGHPMTTQGQGGSIPLCGALAERFPDAEILLIGVEEPRCAIHAPNESVDPTELERMALVEALFLDEYGRRSGGG